MAAVNSCLLNTVTLV